MISSMYAVYHGPDGLRAIAERTHRMAATLAAGLGDAVTTPAFFDTVTVSVPGRAARAVAAAAERGVNIRPVDADRISVACDETTTLEHIRAVWQALAATGVNVDDTVTDADDALPAKLRRDTDYLTHPVFHAHHSETAMLRYLRSLSDKDYALDRGMIPLGSCTMKLNATTEMEPITWPELANMHPYAPASQATGYAQLVDDLQTWLAELTGYDAVSVQPNAGSQGELAGLLAIRAYHRANGHLDRDVCLIPSSAHGTNAASAVMAGMRVVVVACDTDGNVDLVDLDRRIDQHRDQLAAIMVTYPSTHGVYETGIAQLCAKVHDAGGQVYVDGANLNALLGFAKPGRFGADVSHLNLHKTFCIPHGGGGPGGRPGRGPRAPGRLPARASVGGRCRGRTRVGRAARLRRHPADPVGVRTADGSGRSGPGHRSGGPGGELCRGPAPRPLPGAVLGQQGPGRPRMHPGPAADRQGQRRERGRRGQAPGRLRLPRPDDVVPGRRHAHGRTHRVGEPRRAGPVLRGDDRDSPGDRDASPVSQNSSPPLAHVFS